jgi:hypothetical protein
MLSIVLGVSRRVPQGIYGDQAVQMRAARQYVAGQSPSLNTVVEPDPADLTRDHGVWLTSRPPGPQLAVYPWLRLGLSVGAAVRVVAMLALIVGAIGWLAWFAMFEMPPVMRYAAAVALPVVHEASNSFFVFSQDILNFAVAPWILLLARAMAARDRRSATWFGAGLVFGATYIVKYSLVFVGLGALVFLVVDAVRRRRGAGVVWCAIGFVVPIVVMSVLNARYGGAVNSVAAQAGVFPRWTSFVAMIATPALAVADAEGLLNVLMGQPMHPLTPVPLGIGFVGGLIYLWLIIRGARGTVAVRLAVTVFVVSVVMVGAVWTFSAFAADYAARHVMPASLAVFPVAYLGAAELWQRGGVKRVIVAIGAIGFVIVPLLYGAAALVGKARLLPRSYALGVSRVYDPYLASSVVDLATVERRLVDTYGATTDVWYSYDSITALDLPGRVWNAADELAIPSEFRTSRPVRVTLLLKPGRGAEVLGQFRGAGPWTRAVMPGSNYDVWTALVH